MGVLPYLRAHRKMRVVVVVVVVEFKSVYVYHHFIQARIRGHRLKTNPSSARKDNLNQGMF